MTLKLRLLPRSTLKGKVGVRFPASVTGVGGIEVTNAGGAYTIGIDVDELILNLESSFLDFIADYFAGLSNSVQSVTGSSATVSPAISWVLINRTAPSTTALALPNAAGRPGVPLHISDYSQSVTDHTITLTPYQASQKVMRQDTWPLYSNAASLVSVTLWPIVDPDDASNYVWVIAP